MWIVRLALRRPYTFVVGALVLLLLSPFVFLRTPTDIFPSIDIPVISIVWQYQGLSAQEVASDPDHWAQLAFATKEDLMEDQRIAPPFGTRCTIPLEDLAMVVESSGTTAMSGVPGLTRWPSWTLRRATKPATGAASSVRSRVR